MAKTPEATALFNAVHFLNREAKTMRELAQKLAEQGYDYQKAANYIMQAAGIDHATRLLTAEAHKFEKEAE